MALLYAGPCLVLVLEYRKFLAAPVFRDLRGYYGVFDNLSLIHISEPTSPY